MDSPTWHKSSYSGGTRQNCVEIAESPDTVKVRDSQHPHQGHIAVPAREWRAFLAAVRAEEL